MIFNSKLELYNHYITTDIANLDGFKEIMSYKTLEELIEDCSYKLRVSFLRIGYDQFLNKYDKIQMWDLSIIIAEQPKYFHLIKWYPQILAQLSKDPETYIMTIIISAPELFDRLYCYLNADNMTIERLLVNHPELIEHKWVFDNLDKLNNAGLCCVISRFIKAKINNEMMNKLIILAKEKLSNFNEKQMLWLKKYFLDVEMYINNLEVI